MDKTDGPEHLYLMLGEIRADLKYLVNERQRQAERIDTLEEEHAERHAEHHSRLRDLETFKTKIGVVTTVLGVVVPTALTVAAHKLGLFTQP